MNRHPKITIITACYNSEETIEQTIKSVLNQSYDNLEYIIIDGSSTDKTIEIINKYRSKIDVVISEEDKGVYDAFNKGVKLATGDYINFMNSDDFFSTPYVVEEVAFQLNKFPDTRMIHGNVRAFDEKSGHWHYRGEVLSLADFEKGKMCPHQSVFTDKRMFEEFSYFDLKYRILADVDFTIKCFKNYEEKIVYVPIEVARFRLGGLSSSIDHDKRFHDENAAIHLLHFGSIPDYTSKLLQDYEMYYVNQKYRSWLEHILVNRDILSENLIDSSSDNIAIFGTKKNATLLYYYLTGKGKKISCFIDNDERMQNKELHSKPIVPPRDLGKFDIDTIVVSVERMDVAKEIKEELQNKFINTRIYSWYELT